MELVHSYTLDVLRQKGLHAFDSDAVIPEVALSRSLTRSLSIAGAGQQRGMEDEYDVNGSGSSRRGSSVGGKSSHRLQLVSENDGNDKQWWISKWAASMLDEMLAGTPRHMTMRTRAKIKLDNSPGGRSWDVFQVLLSLIACVMHILSTYKENALDDGEDEVQETVGERMLEYVLSGLFAVDLAIHFFVCDHRGWFFTQGDTVIDILTLFPVAIALAGNRVSIDTSFVRALRMLRAMRILRAFRVTKNSLSAVDQKVATLGIIVVSIIFMSACLVQTLEKENGMEVRSFSQLDVIVAVLVVAVLLKKEIK